jgi:hypothetical protein
MNEAINFDPSTAAQSNFLDLATFKDKFLYGHRSHHFHIGLTFPKLLKAAQDSSNYFTIYAKNGEVPEASMDAVTVNWHGLTIMLAKDKQNSGTVSVEFWYDDNEFSAGSKLRETFEKWSQMVISLKANGENLRTFPYEYKGLLNTAQWILNDKVINSWIYVGVWPLKVAKMDHKHETGDVMSYTVDFQFDWNYNYEIKDVPSPTNVRGN